MCWVYGVCVVGMVYTYVYGYVCVCVVGMVYTCVYGHMCMCDVVALYGGQWPTSGIFAGHSPSFVPRHPNLELAR